MYKGKKIIVITGGYNEEGKISKVIERIPKFADFIFVVDDGSKDGTYKEILDSKANKVIKNKKNEGAGNVLKKGLNYSIKNKYDIVVVIGGDNQDNPTEIKRLVSPLINDNYDFTLGSRFLNKKEINKVPKARRLALIVYSRIFNFVIKRYGKVTDASNGFRAFKTNILKSIHLNKKFERYEFEPYMLLELIKKGYRFKEIAVSKEYDRKRGFSKMKPIIDWYRIVKPLFIFR